jgi:hypothetical protein
MSRRPAADSEAYALLPLPSVYDRAWEGAGPIAFSRQGADARRRPDGSIDCGHYVREAERMHRQAVTRTARGVLSAVWRAMPLRRCNQKHDGHRLDR